VSAGLLVVLLLVGGCQKTPQDLVRVTPLPKPAAVGTPARTAPAPTSVPALAPAPALPPAPTLPTAPGLPVAPAPVEAARLAPTPQVTAAKPLVEPILPPPSPVPPKDPYWPTPDTPAAKPRADWPQDGWVPLPWWAETLGLEAPKAWKLGTNLFYSLSNHKGRMVLTVGKHQAQWDGYELWLGYAPQFAGGEPQVHAVDAAKNLMPLLADTDTLRAPNGLVVLDPGHGGENRGARSAVDDRYEKQFTLDWAFRLQPLLEAQGWQVFLTRTNDVDISLAERVAFAEARQAELFISLHFNSDGAKGDQVGLETYCLTPPGLPSTLLRGPGDDATALFPNNSYDGENLRLAVRLHRELVRETAAPDRGVRHARFMGVLRGQNRPAVLLEGGYLSNRREARLIGSPQYRQQLAEAIARALGPAPRSAQPNGFQAK
jgi:N-acetylmuramoyl-L-alanine amidase